MATALTRLEAHLRMLPGFYDWVKVADKEAYKLLDAIYATVTALQTEADLMIAEADYASLRADRLYVELGFGLDWKKFSGWTDDQYRSILIGLNKAFLMGFTQPGVQAGLDLFLADRFTYDVYRVESDLVQDIKRFRVIINMSAIPSDIVDVLTYLRKFLDDIKAVTSVYDLGFRLTETYHGEPTDSLITLLISLATPEEAFCERYRNNIYLDCSDQQFNTTDQPQRCTFVGLDLAAVEARDLLNIHDDTGGVYLLQEF